MEKLVEELKQALPFKNTTIEGDIVLVAAKVPHILSYGVVCGIERDETRKDEWWHVTIKLLGVPLHKITWTLRRAQFTGQEIFTMGGEKRFIQAIDPGVESKKEGSCDTKKKSPKNLKPLSALRRVK